MRWVWFHAVKCNLICYMCKTLFIHEREHEYTWVLIYLDWMFEGMLIVWINFSINEMGIKYKKSIYQRNIPI